MVRIQLSSSSVHTSNYVLKELSRLIDNSKHLKLLKYSENHLCLDVSYVKNKEDWWVNLYLTPDNVINQALTKFSSYELAKMAINKNSQNRYITTIKLN